MAQEYQNQANTASDANTNIIDDLNYRPSILSQSFRLKGFFYRSIGRLALYAGAYASVYPYIKHSETIGKSIIFVYIVMAICFVSIESIARNSFLKAREKKQNGWACGIAAGVFIAFITDACGTYGFIITVAEGAREKEKTNLSIQNKIDEINNRIKRVSKTINKNESEIRKTSMEFNAIGHLTKAKENNINLNVSSQNQIALLSQEKEIVQLMKSNTKEINPLLETHKALAKLFNTSLDRVNVIFSALIALAFSYGGILLCSYKTDEEEFYDKQHLELTKKEIELSLSKKKNLINNMIMKDKIEDKKSRYALLVFNKKIQIDLDGLETLENGSETLESVVTPNGVNTGLHGCHTVRENGSSTHLPNATKTDMEFFSKQQLDNMLNRYEVAKNSKKGQKIKCPYCANLFTKRVDHHIFCSSKGENDCKNKYWNVFKPKVKINNVVSLRKVN